MTTDTPTTDTPTTGTPTSGTLSRERTDLLETLAKHRGFLLFTVRALTDEQARQRPTVSQLQLAGLLKHVASTERLWADFAERGPAAFTSASWSADAWAAEWEMQPGETLASVLERYAEVARRTDALVASLPDLDAEHPLPVAPWFERGACWSVRRTFLHVIAETAQHAGHADILRESIDGQKTMG